MRKLMTPQLHNRYKLHFVALALCSAVCLPVLGEDYGPLDYSIVPPAPQVEALMDFKEYPVDYFHRSPEIGQSEDSLYYASAWHLENITEISKMRNDKGTTTVTPESQVEEYKSRETLVVKSYRKVIPDSTTIIVQQETSDK